MVGIVYNGDITWHFPQDSLFCYGVHFLVGHSYQYPSIITRRPSAEQYVYLFTTGMSRYKPVDVGK